MLLIDVILLVVATGANYFLKSKVIYTLMGIGILFLIFTRGALTIPSFLLILPGVMRIIYPRWIEPFIGFPSNWN